MARQSIADGADFVSLMIRWRGFAIRFRWRGFAIRAIRYSDGVDLKALPSSIPIGQSIANGTDLQSISDGADLQSVPFAISDGVDLKALPSSIPIGQSVSDGADLQSVPFAIPMVWI